MNNSEGCFASSVVKPGKSIKTKVAFREFIFEDFKVTGSFLFKEMKLELYETGKWCFYITAEGLKTTTILRNGRKSGPMVKLAFRDSVGNIVDEVSLGQVNYDCKEDSNNSYICRGDVIHPESINTIEVMYDAFLDFACRRN